MAVLEKVFKIRLDSQKKRLVENFFSLSILQGVNYTLPLITLPYLVRILGPEKYGLIAFAQAFIQYFNILTDYGFNLSATREISINRKDKEKVSEIFSSVMIIKFALLIVSLLFMSIIVFSFEKFKKDWLLYYFTFGVVLGQILFPIWFFQGMERMKYITILNVISKLIFTFSIFAFIHKASDYIYVPLINSLGFIIGGILALWIIFKNFGIKLKIPNLNNIKYHLKEGGYIFLSRISISFYTISNIFILGLLTSNTIVGYYSLAEKFINIIKNINNAILQVMFPFVSKVINNERDKALNYIKKEIHICLIGGIFISSLMIFCAKFLTFFVFGKKFSSSIPIFQILSITPFVIMLSTIIGQQIFLNFNLKKAFTFSIIYPSILHLLVLFILVNHLSALGAAIAVLFTESTILFLRLFMLWRERRDIFRLLFIGAK